MFKSIYITELKRNLKSTSFYIFIGVFFLIAHMFASNVDPNVGVAMIIGREWHNAPLVIARFFAFLSVYGILFTIIMVGKTVTKDFKAQIHDFFFTIPMSKATYLGGRFLGGLTANLFVFSGIILGFFSGCLAIDIKYYGPFEFSAFLYPILIILIPNLIFIGSIFFSLATLSRKTVMTFMASIILLVVYGLTSVGLQFVDNEVLRILTDPFAIASLSIITKYWTIADINANTMPMTNLLILNRCIWLIVSFAVLLYTWKKFKFVSVLEGKKNNNNGAEELAYNYSNDYNSLILNEITLYDSFLSNVKKCLHLINYEFKRIAIHPAFLILTILTMLNLVLNFYGNVGDTGNSPYPLTSWFLDQTKLMWVYTIPLIIFFGGVIVWRERDYDSNQFYDTLPLSDWMYYLSKLFTMMLIIFIYIVLIIFTGIASQVFIFGWTELELGLYFKHLFGIDLLNYWHVAIVVLFIQNIVNNKYLGFFLSALYFIVDIIVFNVIGYDNILLHYGHIPSFIYSNLNGFGPYAQIIIWYSIYWLVLAVVIAIISSLLWRRSEETNLKFRVKNAIKKLSLLPKISLTAFIILFIIIGSIIYSNKYILNQYMSKDDVDNNRALYEKKYSKFKHAPQPIMTHIDLEVDFFPERRDVFIKGQYQLENKTNDVIDSIFVNLSDRKITKVNNLQLSEPSELIYCGAEFGFRIFKLKYPLNPGESIQFNFNLEAQTIGFSDNNPKPELALNGSWISLSVWGKNEYFPFIGYVPGHELKGAFKRNKFDLMKRPEYPALEDAENLNASFITYNAIVSTTNSQVAISNGNLLKSWTKNNRNYYHYNSDIPLQNDIVLISGEYEIATAKQDDITIEVYYNKNHHWNIDRIIKGSKSGLAYCSTNFSQYPYSAFRVVEVPNYANFGAMSQPTLVIWRESAGFTANITDSEDIDKLFGITAHEIAHDWWPCTVMSAYAEGMELVSEAIAQYVWIMCMEKEYGKTMARKQLKEDMNDYLRLRKRDRAGERPLDRAFLRYYLSYAKSIVAMYALQDYIGEDNVNLALKQLVELYGYKENMQLTSHGFIKAVKAVTPDSMQYLIHDLFETITLHENKAITATSERLDNRQFKVILNVAAHKFRADSVGVQTEIPVNDYIYIGVLGDNDEELYLQKHKITKNESKIEIVVDKEPVRAGIDPFVLLIDRNRDDNMVDIVKL